MENSGLFPTKLSAPKPKGSSLSEYSIRVEPKALAIPVIALANADGGTL